MVDGALVVEIERILNFAGKDDYVLQVVGRDVVEDKLHHRVGVELVWHAEMLIAAVHDIGTVVDVMFERSSSVTSTPPSLAHISISAHEGGSRWCSHMTPANRLVLASAIGRRWRRPSKPLEVLVRGKSCTMVALLRHKAEGAFADR